MPPAFRPDALAKPGQLISCLVRATLSIGDGTPQTVYISPLRGRHQAAVNSEAVCAQYRCDTFCVPLQTGPGTLDTAALSERGGLVTSKGTTSVAPRALLVVGFAAPDSAAF